MRKLYEALSVDVVKFEAQDVITASGALTEQNPTETPVQSEAPGTEVPGTEVPEPTEAPVPTEEPVP